MFLVLLRSAMKHIGSLLVAAVVCLLPLIGRPDCLEHPAPWLAFALLAATFMTQPREHSIAPRSSREKLSLVFITVGSLGVVLAAVFELRFRYKLHPPPASMWVICGAALSALGFGLRLWAIAALGRHFSSSLRVSADQSVVDSGPYRWVRHPAFSGVLLLSSGLALAFASMAAAGVTLGVLLPAYLFRIRLEEEQLIATLNASYAVYRARTKALVPFLL